MESRTDEAALTQSRILIVDDQQPNVLLLERLLAAHGFVNVTGTTRSDLAERYCAEVDPHLLVLDLQMPEPDGFEIMRRLHYAHDGSTLMPIIVLTADYTDETKRRALASGASDFLHKPVDAIEVILRIKNLLSTRLLQLELNTHNVLLEQRVAERTSELEHARVEIIKRLAHAAEYRDDETGEHTQRVGRTAALIADQLVLPQDDVARIQQAAPLHDVGKLGISDAILLKPGKLTTSEFEIMKTHAAIGADILSGSQSKLLQVGELIARTHHERWDGTGYPDGLHGEQIPLQGRIVALADVFDALTHSRPYKHAWPTDQALKEIHRLNGHHFDPAIVAAFSKLNPHELTDAPSPQENSTLHLRQTA
jgi:putative two-component system response regulator